ncbi:MAG: HemK family modification methylase, release factor glutamine methyltransferase [Candidatus Peregrinibacteria bacterium GW2011_GWC2_39_14]|nr:MAG: HemK family modification methylase, release factor glutamine methyltransferase [Candidatus Peregrinibacteria bacterium GW2011_GWC2_39_14]
MTISETLKFGKNKLFGRENAYLEAEILLMYVLDKTREYLFKNPSIEVGYFKMLKFRKYLSMVSRGFPIAYITQKKEFFGKEFYVNENVLIPRPETEILVENTIDILHRYFAYKKVVLADIGSGSGCIGVSVALNCKDVFVKFVDISRKALKVAIKNVDKYEISKRAEFVKGSLLNKLFEQRIDVMVANLPYIGTEKYNSIDENVKKYEPHSALYSGKDGLDLYREFFEQLSKMKYPPKFVLGEFGFGQGSEILAISNKFFVQKPVLKKDYAGIERMFILSL